MTSASPNPAGANPAGLRVATAVLALQGFVAAGLAVAELVALQPGRATLGLGVAILLLGYAAGLLVVARGLWRRRRWSRGPAVATQLLMLPVAWTFHQGPTWWATLVLGGLALAALVGLLVPSTTVVLAGPRD